MKEEQTVLLLPIKNMYIFFFKKTTLDKNTDLSLSSTHKKEVRHRNSNSRTNVKEKQPCRSGVPAHCFTKFCD